MRSKILIRNIHYSANEIFGVDVSKRDTSDVLVCGLNADQDITVKVVSCREVIQESMIKNDLTPEAAKTLGEVMVCSLMMGSGLKDQETLQVNLVGNSGLKNVMAITDGDLAIRGMVGNTRFNIYSESEKDKMRNLLGEGQVQVVRNHPFWKSPMNGIVALRDAKVSLNLALYMAESEQRTCYLMTDVRVDGTLCRHALGIMVERLPGATDENIAMSVQNVEEVERKGLRSYLTRTKDDPTTSATDASSDSEFRDFEPILGRVVDDCLANLGESFRFSKKPFYRCSCGMDRIWRTLSLLPKTEIKDILETDDMIEMKCEFCGKKFVVTKAEVYERILTDN